MALSQKALRAANASTKVSRTLTSPVTKSTLLPATSNPHSPRHDASRTFKTHAKAEAVATVGAPLGGGMMGELANLRSFVESFPFVSQGPKAQPRDEFKFTPGTLFNAPTAEIGLKMAPVYAHALRHHGVAAISLGFNDPDSQFLEAIVEAIGCKADVHSATQGALWDVKYNPAGVKSEGSDKSAHSISHSLGEFDWHTDAAFETNPMRYFGFHIIHPDKMGGGVFRLLRAQDLTSLLSARTIDTLLHKDFDLKVPMEFFKGQHTIRGKLLHRDEESGKILVRFRRDILQDPPSDDPAACSAVSELLSLLDKPERVGMSMPTFAFKENTVLLMDNAQFLHSRTNIKDPKRWLRRIRFRGDPGAASEE